MHLIVRRTELNDKKKKKNLLTRRSNDHPNTFRIVSYVGLCIRLQTTWCAHFICDFLFICVNFFFFLLVDRPPAQTAFPTLFVLLNKLYHEQKKKQHPNKNSIKNNFH